MQGYPGQRRRWAVSIAFVAVVLVCGAVYYYQRNASPPAGIVVWHVDAGKPFIHDLALDDSQLYVAGGSRDESLFAFDLDGNPAWDFTPDPRPISECGMAGYSIECLAVAPDGTVYAGGGDGVLYALSPAGKLLWKRDTAPAVRSPLRPFIHPDGRIFTLDGRGSLCSFTPDGCQLDSVELGGYFLWQQRIVWDAKQRFRVVDSKNQRVICVNANGSLAWSVPLPGKVFTLSLGPHDEVCVPVLDGDLYCIDAEGNTLWSSSLGSFSLPAFDAAGNLYAPEGHLIRVLSPTGAQIRVIGRGTGLSFGDCTIRNDRLYVQSFRTEPEWLLELRDRIGSQPPPQSVGMSCFDLHGRQLWMVKLPQMLMPLCTPVFDSGDNVYLACYPEADLNQKPVDPTKEHSTVWKAHSP